MKTYIYTIITVLVLAVAGFGQSQGCDLTIKDSPAIRGFKLGMNRKEFLQVFPIDLADQDNNSLYLRSKSFPNRKIFEGVEYFMIKFFEDKIYAIKIQYENAPEWENSKEFAKNVSDNLQLPFSAWKHSIMDSSMTCKEFSVNADRLNFLKFEDLIALGRIQAAEIKSAEDKKKAFKP